MSRACTIRLQFVDEGEVMLRPPSLLALRNCLEREFASDAERLQILFPDHAEVMEFFDPVHARDLLEKVYELQLATGHNPPGGRAGTVEEVLEMLDNLSLRLALALHKFPAEIDAMPARDALALGQLLNQNTQDQRKWEAALRGIRM